MTRTILSRSTARLFASTIDAAPAARKRRRAVPPRSRAVYPRYGRAPSPLILCGDPARHGPLFAQPPATTPAQTPTTFPSFTDAAQLLPLAVGPQPSTCRAPACSSGPRRGATGEAAGRYEKRPGLEGARVYYHRDHLGSVRVGVGPAAGTAGSGTEVWEAKACRNGWDRVKDRTLQHKEEPATSRLQRGSQPRPVQRRRVDVQPALSDDLMERVLDRQNLKRAWKQVRANRGAPGVDAMTLTAFPEVVRTRWASIRQSLSDGTYRPQPVRRHVIPKPTGGERQLGIDASFILHLIQGAWGW